MTVLITGGAGFIGSALAHYLINLSITVVIIDDLSKGHRSNAPNEAEFILGDCSEPSTFDCLIGRKIDVIYHLAGQSSGERSFHDPERDLRSNVLSTLRIIAFAEKNEVNKLIYASTMSVYGDGPVPSHEKQSTRPLSYYGVGKLASEGYLQIYSGGSTQVSCVRLFNVYGPGQDLADSMQGMVSIFLSQVINDEHIVVKGDLNRFRDFIFINDVVCGLYKLGFETEKLPVIINFSSGVKTTVGQLINIIMKTFKINKKIIVTEGTKGDQYGIVGNGNIMQEHGIKMNTDLESGIMLTYEFIKSARSNE